LVLVLVDGFKALLSRQAASVITYHQLRTFLAVARTGSLTKAAREMNATQPTVSLQLHALRKFLGTPLFERPGGRFQLTPAGERLRRYAEESVGGLRSLQQDVAALNGSLAGPLAVGATFVVSRYVLPSALSRFREQFPDVDLQLHVELPEPLFGDLLSNALDVGCHIGARTPPGLTVERLGGAEFVIIASPRHPLAGQGRTTPHELSEHPFVAFVSAPLRELIETKLRSAGVTPRVMAEGRHHDAVKKLVERSAGYAMLIRASVEDDLARHRLVALELDGPPILGEIVMTYRSQPVVSPLVREFIRSVRAELEGKHDATPVDDASRRRKRHRPAPAGRSMPGRRS
jgi:DNA-binding transcriptional LysR family regulator